LDNPPKSVHPSSMPLPHHRIATIPGDGIGGEVVPEGRRVLDAAAKRHGFRLEWEEFPWSCEYYAKPGG
jgi:tartrate dehydrogenase/decarboxylase/D-malate dehydrogenase